MNALLLVAVMAVSPAAQDGAPAAPSAATGVIHGHVTELESGRPLPRFRVSLSTRPLSDENSRALDTVLTGADGAYQFTAVRPGRYLITARPPEHVATHLAKMYGDGEPLPIASARRLAMVDLKPGDSREANIALRRSLAIEGRVMTQEGDPLANALVSLERLDRSALRQGIPTDDRGYYRHYRLAPGRYRVCATPAAPNDPMASATRESVLKTCLAGAPAAGTGTLELTTTDIQDADIVMMRQGRRFIVSGAVVDTVGAPLDGADLSFVEQHGRPRRSLKVERLQRGRFMIRDAEPGTYTLRADVRPQPPAVGGPRELGAVEIVVDARDITDVLVRTRRLALVFGIVTFEGGTPASYVDQMVVTMRMDPAPDTAVPDAVASRTVREDLTFELASVPEPVKLGLNYFPTGWVVKSILYRGREVTDQPVVLDASDDTRAIEILLTDRVAFVTGSVAGVAPQSTVLVLAFRVDKVGNASTAEAVPVAGTALVDDRRGFKLGPLELGDYYVVAVDRNQWFDASLLNRAATVGSLIPRAERVAVVEGAQPTIAIRVQPVQ